MIARCWSAVAGFPLQLNALPLRDSRLPSHARAVRASGCAGDTCPAAFAASPCAAGSARVRAGRGCARQSRSLLHLGLGAQRPAAQLAQPFSVGPRVQHGPLLPPASARAAGCPKMDFGSPASRNDGASRRCAAARCLRSAGTFVDRPWPSCAPFVCKVLRHNLVVLIHEMYELGLDPVFWATASVN